MRNWLQHIVPLLSRSLRAGAKPLILSSVGGVLLLFSPLLTSCSEDHPDEPYSDQTRTAIPDSTQVDVSIVVDTTWQDTLDYDFDGNEKINTNSDTTTIPLPDMPEEGDAGDAA